MAQGPKDRGLIAMLPNDGGKAIKPLFFCVVLFKIVSLQCALSNFTQSTE